MAEVEIPMKGIVSGIIGLVTSGLFVIMGWLDAWIYFAVVVVAALIIVNQNYTLFPVGIVGMLGSGIFTKMGWLDPIIFFSALIMASLILAQQIVAHQLDIGHGSSGTSGGK